MSPIVKPMHVCPRCSRLHDGKGRCPTCTRPARQGTSFYNSSRWQKIRAVVRARDKACVRCHTTTTLSVHHIDGDWRNNAMINLETLCLRCHGETDGGKERVSFLSTKDLPTPVQSAFYGNEPGEGVSVG